MNDIVEEATAELSLELCQDYIRDFVADYLEEERRRKEESSLRGMPMVDVLAEAIFVEVTGKLKNVCEKDIFSVDLQPPNLTIITSLRLNPEPLVLSAVQEAVREIAKELTFEIELTSCEVALLEEIVPDMVREEASEVLHEFELLQAAEKLIDEVASEEVRFTVDRDFPMIREQLEKRQVSA